MSKSCNFAFKITKFIAMNNHVYFRFVGTGVLLLMLFSCKKGKDGNTVPKYYPTEVLAPVNRIVQVQYSAILKGRAECGGSHRDIGSGYGQHLPVCTEIQGAL